MTSIGARVVIAASNAARKLGKSLEAVGSKIETVNYTEGLVPSTRFVSIGEAVPFISESVSFIAPTANVIGNVEISESSSIWYGATVRSEISKLVVGKNSSIGDRAIIHDAKNEGGCPTSIGNNVNIGPGVIVHASTIEDNILIGASTQILEGCIIRSKSIIAPGSILTSGTLVSSGELWAGSPAKMTRFLTIEEVACLSGFTKDTCDLANIHALECEKSFGQIISEEEIYGDNLEKDSEYWQPVSTDARKGACHSSMSHHDHIT